MEKLVMLLPLFVVLYLIWGIFMFVIPIHFNRVEKKVARTFHLISEKRAATAISRRDVVWYRVRGLCYALVCSFLLLNMHLQVGRVPGNAHSIQTRQTIPEVTGVAKLSTLVQDIVSPLMPKHAAPALIIATIADNEQDISGFGRIALNSDQPPDGQTIFEIGSLSKVFTGIVLADRIVHNTLTLETPVISQLQALPVEPDAVKSTITLSHLVTHTSGFPRLPGNTFEPYRLWAAFTADNFYRKYTEETVLKSFASVKLRSVPGERFAYSNFGFGLLGILLGHQSQMEYHEVVRNVIAEPLGMKDTGVHLNEEQQARLALGYRSALQLGGVYFAQTANNWEMPNCMAGAGGLRSTADDMLAFLAANMGRNESALTLTLKLSHQRVFEVNPTFQLAMSWAYDILPKSGKTIIFHDGMTGGYASFLGFSENGRFGVVILSNLAKSVDSLGYTILDTLSLTW